MDEIQNALLWNDLEEANEQITQLESDLAKYKRLYEKNRKFLNTTMKRLEDSSWENEQDLKLYLAKFGGHTAQCKTKQHDYSTGTGWGKCDCGWVEIERGL